MYLATKYKPQAYVTLPGRYMVTPCLPFAILTLILTMIWACGIIMLAQLRSGGRPYSNVRT